MFVRLVSHEIRTPLNIVLTGLRLLRKDLMKGDWCQQGQRDKLLETVNDSEASCGTAVEILDDLLTYEKLDAGLMQLEETTFPAWAFLKETTRAFNIQVPPSTRLPSTLTNYLWYRLSRRECT